MTRQSNLSGNFSQNEDDLCFTINHGYNSGEMQVNIYKNQSNPTQNETINVNIISPIKISVPKSAFTDTTYTPDNISLTGITPNEGNKLVILEYNNSCVIIEISLPLFNFLS